MKSTSKLNFLLVAFAVAAIGAFLVLAVVQLKNGMGHGTLFTTEPLFHQGVAMPAVLSGATVVCFSFIGFDAITMYAEEAKKKSDISKAIIITLLIGGGIFLLTGFVAQAVFPNVHGFELVDDTLPEMALQVGGRVFQMVFMSAAFAATVASALASHASVSRMLHVMGRNKVLYPQGVLATIHPRRHTPVGSVIVVGVVSLLAISPSLELISSMINFGALVAFSFVNLSVIAFFAWRRREYNTTKHVARNIVLPAVGFVMTGILWSFLHADALIAGCIWAAIGVVYAVVLSKVTGRKVTGRKVTDVVLEENAEVVEAPQVPVHVTTAPERELVAAV